MDRDSLSFGTEDDDDTFCTVAMVALGSTFLEEVFSSSSLALRTFPSFSLPDTLIKSLLSPSPE